MKTEPAETVVTVAAYRTDIFENLPNGNLSRLILDAREVSNPDQDWTPLVPASALDTAKAEAVTLRERVRVLEEAIANFKPLGQVAFLWQTKGALPGEVERYRDAYQALLATLSPAVKEPK